MKIFLSILLFLISYPLTANSYPKNPQIDIKKINSAMYFGYLQCLEKSGKITRAQNKQNFEEYLKKERLPLRFFDKKAIYAAVFVEKTIKKRFGKKCEKAILKLDGDPKFKRKVAEIIVYGL